MFTVFKWLFYWSMFFNFKLFFTCSHKNTKKNHLKLILSQTIWQRKKAFYYSLESAEEVEILSKPVENVSGSGDSFTATLITSLLRDASMDQAIRNGISVAQVTARSPTTVVKNDIDMSEIQKQSSLWRYTRIYLS